MSRRQAFTLVELVVVVALITSLLAILIPSMGSARRFARAAKCVANLQQISIANRSYILSNKRIYPWGLNQLPPVLYATWDVSKAIPHPELLFSYAGSTVKIWVCPDDPAPENYNWWLYGNHPSFSDSDPTDDNPENDQCSYMFSEQTVFGIGLNEPGNGYPGTLLRSSQVLRPSTFVYAADGTSFPNGWNWWTVDPEANPAFRINRFHGDNLSFLFGDGHVELMPWRGAAAYRTHPLRDW